MQYISVSHCTSNENGDEEIEIFYKNGFFRDLFKIKERSEIWVYSGGIWYNKKTNKGASTRKFYEIEAAKRWALKNDCYTDLIEQSLKG